MDVKRAGLRLFCVLALSTLMGLAAAVLLGDPAIGHAQPISLPSRPAHTLQDTLVFTDITADLTWNVAGSPYTIPDYKIKVDDATLTIEPGVTVCFSGTNSTLDVKEDARLLAVGTSAQPITFTSCSPAPSPGDWQGIDLRGWEESSILQHVIVEYGSYGLHIGNSPVASNTPHYVLSSTLRYIAGEAIGDSPDYGAIAYNTIYSSGQGIWLNQSGFNDIHHNTIYGIAYDGLRLNAGATPNRANRIAFNRIHDCGGAAIYVEDSVWITVTDNVLYGNALAPASGSNVGAVVIDSSLAVEVEGNHVYANGEASGSYHAALYVAGTSGLTVRGNVLRDSYGDGMEYAASNSGTPTIEGNVLCAHCSSSGPHGLQNLDGIISAASNWWGINTPQSGVEITGVVDFAPWITLTLMPDRAALPADGVSTAIVTVTMHDGTGTTVPTAARTISLTASDGSVAPGPVVLNDDGTATALLTAAQIPGTVTVTATDGCGFEAMTIVEILPTDLAITKDVEVSEVMLGSKLTYTIGYSNTAEVLARDVWITDTLSDCMAYVSDGSAYPAHTSPGQVGWYLGDVGAQISGSFVVTVVAGGAGCGDVLTNSVQISTRASEVSLANNTAVAPGVGVIPATTFMPLVVKNHVGAQGSLREDLPLGPHPGQLVISEAHDRVYVTLYDDDGNGNPGGDGRLAVLDRTTREVVAKVSTGGRHPSGIAVSGGRLYVANGGSDTVAVIEASSLALLDTIPVGGRPFGMAAAGDRVYVTNFEDGTLSIIDAQRGVVTNTVTVGLHPGLPAAWGDCAYVPNGSGRESVTVVCDDGAEVHRLREEWGYLSATVDPLHSLVYLSNCDGPNPGLYEIPVEPPYQADKPVRKKDMSGSLPFAVGYNPTTNHILVVVAAKDQLYFVWPGGYATAYVRTIPPQLEGPEMNGGLGIDTAGHEVWVANYADASVTVLRDPP